MNQIISIANLVCASLSFGCALLILYIQRRLILKRLFVYIAIFIIIHSLDNILYSLMLFKQMSFEFFDNELVVWVLRFSDAFPFIFIMIDTGCIRRSRKIDFVIFWPLILFFIIVISSPFYGRALNQINQVSSSLPQIIIKLIIENLYIIFIFVGSGIYLFIYFCIYKKTEMNQDKNVRFLVNTLFLYQVIERFDCLQMIFQSIPEYLFIYLYTLCLAFLHYRVIKFCILLLISFRGNILNQKKFENKIRRDDRFLFLLYKKIVTLLRNNKLYQNPELTLDDIASLVKVNRVLVSQAINNYNGENFNRLINRFRVNEMKNQLLHDNSRSIFEIGLDAGFNSRATMNRMFQKLEHQSPREYRENLMMNNLNREDEPFEIEVLA